MTSAPVRACTAFFMPDWRRQLTSSCARNHRRSAWVPTPDTQQRHKHIDTTHTHSVRAATESPCRNLFRHTCSVSDDGSARTRLLCVSVGWASGRTHLLVGPVGRSFTASPCACRFVPRCVQHLSTAHKFFFPFARYFRTPTSLRMWTIRARAWMVPFGLVLC